MKTIKGLLLPFILLFLAGAGNDHSHLFQGNNYWNNKVNFGISKPDDWQVLDVEDAINLERSPPMSPSQKAHSSKKLEKMMRGEETLGMKPLSFVKHLDEEKGEYAEVLVVRAPVFHKNPSYLMIDTLSSTSNIGLGFRHETPIKKKKFLGFESSFTQYSYEELSKKKNLKIRYFIEYWIIVREEDYFQIVLSAPEEEFHKFEKTFKEVLQSIKFSK